MVEEWAAWEWEVDLDPTIVQIDSWEAAVVEWEEAWATAEVEDEAISKVCCDENIVFMFKIEKKKKLLQSKKNCEFRVPFLVDCFD